MFLNPHIDVDTRWAITDALTLVDSEIVLRSILPLLNDQYAEWFDPLVYLIGQMRTSNPDACRFVEGFLEDAKASYQTQGRAIAAIGALRLSAWRERFEDIRARRSRPHRRRRRPHAQTNRTICAARRLKLWLKSALAIPSNGCALDAVRGAAIRTWNGFSIPRAKRYSGEPGN